MPENMKQNPNNTTAANKKKPSLGRGLGSLLGGAGNLSDDRPTVTTQAPVVTTQTSQTSGVSNQQPVRPAPQINEEQQIWTIPVDRLVPNTQQPRQTFTPEALRDLTASIKEKGILQPITARRLGERQFEIIAGERRWRAAQAAGLHEVPVILKKVSEQDSLEYAIIENIQREDLNPMEEAEAYEHLMHAYSLTQQQVADKLGKERSSVANSIRLIALPAELKIMVRKNELSAGHAKVLLSIDDSHSQIELAKQVISERLSVRATEKLAARAKSEKRDAAVSKKPDLDVDVSRRLIDGLSAEIQKLVGTKVSIDYADAKGKLQIHFYSDDQLTQIVEKIRRSWEK
jgi:ParB family chromosome partitioning protein